jgi:hypothetical protein
MLILLFSTKKQHLGKLKAYETNMLLWNAQENENNFQQQVSSILPLKNKLLQYEIHTLYILAFSPCNCVKGSKLCISAKRYLFVWS